jgi:hypothetical protein
MKRSRDPLPVSPHWHVDLRLEAELPEDTVIGVRFLVHVAFSAVALVAVIFAGYKGYIALSLDHEVRDWEKRINDNRAEVADITRMQREYSVESLKIDQAYALVRPQLYVSAFISSLGRTRPERMLIDLIDWSEAGIVLRGSLRERSDRATEILGGYIDQLRRDAEIGPLFREIILTDLDRGASGEILRFEIKFSLKGGT